MTSAILIGIFIAAFIAWALRAAMPHSDLKLISVIALTFVTAAGYLWLGNPFINDKISDYRSKTGALVERITELEEQLALVESEDGKTQAAILVEIGQNWMRLQQYKNAVASYRQAVVASEGAGEIILAYGKAQMMAAGGIVDDGASKAFMMAAAVMPENPEPLFFLAIEKAQHGETETAREAMQTLSKAFPEYEMLQLAIKEELAKIEAVSPTPK